MKLEDCLPGVRVVIWGMPAHHPLRDAPGRITEAQPAPVPRDQSFPNGRIHVRLDDGKLWVVPEVWLDPYDLLAA